MSDYAVKGGAKANTNSYGMLREHGDKKSKAKALKEAFKKKMKDREGQQKALEEEYK